MCLSVVISFIISVPILVNLYRENFVTRALLWGYSQIRYVYPDCAWRHPRLKTEPTLFADATKFLTGPTSAKFVSLWVSVFEKKERNSVE